MRSFLCLSIGLILCLFLPACSSGPKPLKVNGKLTYNSKPLHVDPKGSVNVTFIPVFEDGKPHDNFLAEVNRDDMSFVVKGKTGEGIVPGKYRIAIMQMTPAQTPEVIQMNQHFTQQDSPIIREISSEEPIVLELSKAEGK